ncbi:MAG TPA: UDP-2,3-diacylglucosamine diphosphatase LpxI [Candidatus Omnitrophota bacterium]|nr:UDP-2,3-diacylglucosamine diphosphatase LpxI [Candidatus Omnitrophota bacterium]
MERIGLIAGNRRFPILFCEAARERGVHVVAVAIRGETDRRIIRLAQTVHWVSLSEFERVFDIFRKEKITKVVMAGQVSPAALFSRQVRDSKAIQDLFSSIGDRKANTIFSAIAGRLSAQGLELIDSTTFLQSFVPQAGVLTQRQPSESEWEDIRFGMDLAKKVADLDIGLTVAVKHRAIVAVEALEGTDNLIRRAGRICKGLVIAKAGRPAQDMRFDIPVIGLNTIKTLIRARVTCLAIEAKKTLVIDMKSAIALADRKGIAVVSV